MRYRTIAGSDVQVSEVGFGVWTMATGWWGQYTDEQSTTLLRQSFDRGITFFDTADTYGNGRGETARKRGSRTGCRRSNSSTS